MTSHKTHPQDDQTRPSTKEREREIEREREREKEGKREREKEGKREREKYTSAGRNHTQKFNRILVEEQIYCSCSRPLHHIFCDCIWGFGLPLIVSTYTVAMYKDHCRRARHLFSRWALG